MCFVFVSIRLCYGHKPSGAKVRCTSRNRISIVNNWRSHCMQRSSLLTTEFGGESYRTSDSICVVKERSLFTGVIAKLDGMSDREAL